MISINLIVSNNEKIDFQDDSNQTLHNNMLNMTHKNNRVLKKILSFLLFLFISSDFY